MRSSTRFLIFAAAVAVLAAMACGHAALARRAAPRALERQAAIVRGLGLADLCLFNEATYTRHLSRADRATPFQDHPVSLEHFPSGSLVSPPRDTERPR